MRFSSIHSAVSLATTAFSNISNLSRQNRLKIARYTPLLWLEMLLLGMMVFTLVNFTGEWLFAELSPLSESESSESFESLDADDELNSPICIGSEIDEFSSIELKSVH